MFNVKVVCILRFVYVQRFQADMLQFPFCSDLSLTKVTQICSDKARMEPRIRRRTVAADNETDEQD